MPIRFTLLLFSFFMFTRIGLAQDKRLFVPYPNIGDSLYYYEVSNPEVVQFKMFESPPIWYLDQSVSPCHILSLSKKKAEKTIWTQGKEIFTFQNKKPQYAFESAVLRDPFTHNWSLLELDDNPIVFNDASSLPVYQSQEFEGSFIFEVDKIDGALKDLMIALDIKKLKVKFGLNKKTERENLSKILHPFDQINGITFKITDTYVPLDFEGKRNTDWQKLSGPEIQNLFKYFEPVTQSKVHFMDNGTKSPLGMVELDPTDKTKYLGGHYLHTVASKRIKPCKLKRASIYLFPNPNFGKFYLKMYGHEEGSYKIKVYNIIGQELFQAPLELSGNENMSVNIPNIPKGTYIYSIENDRGENIMTKRLLIMGL